MRLSTLFFMFLSISCACQQPTLELPQMPLHDPWILAYRPTHTYYLYTSNVPSLTKTAGAGTMIYTSRDLKHWTVPKVVFTAERLTWAKDGGWAPEVHFFRGRFYLFTTFHNQEHKIPQPTPLGHDTYMRGTIIAVADAPEGPFQPLKTTGPITPENFMALDGTFFVDEGGKPWMVYAHEWLQKLDGTMEAIPLKPDLSAANGEPIHLFKASDAPWINGSTTPNTAGSRYVTDGPELFRTKDGHLLMLWSSYERNLYVQTIARSKTGRLQGPWVPAAASPSSRLWAWHAFPQLRWKAYAHRAPSVPKCTRQDL